MEHKQGAGSLFSTEFPRRKFLGLSAAVAGAAALASCSSSSSTSPSGSASAANYGGLSQFTVADWGGSTNQAILTAWGTPFTKATGIPVVATSISYGKVQAQVQSNNVTWNWGDFEGWFTRANPSLLEPLDYGTIGLAQGDMVDPSFLQPDAVANYVYAWCMGYRTDATAPHPTTWVEFFDTSAFPGKRSLYNYCYGTLEIALLGDGVPFNQLYPLDVPRALKKIGTIKKDLVWWNTGAEAQEFLVSKAADYVAGWNPRFGYLALSGLPIGIEWNTSFLAADYHAVPKGGNRAASMEFIKEACKPEAQAAFAQLAGGLGCPTKKGNDLLSDGLKPWVPTSPDNVAKSLGTQNDQWWGQNFDAANTQFNKFVAG
jgi:putative spermidine/putrescine transport system substrate-binding protein